MDDLSPLSVLYGLILRGCVGVLLSAMAGAGVEMRSDVAPTGLAVGCVQRNGEGVYGSCIFGSSHAGS